MGELLADDGEEAGSIRRQQRVRATFHVKGATAELAAALERGLAAAVDPDCERVSNGAPDVYDEGDRLAVETIVATSALQDERDVDDIVSRGLKGDDAILAWSRSPRRLSEAAVQALADLDLADHEAALGLSSSASAVAVSAQPLGDSRSDPAPRPVVGRPTAADCGFAVTVTLAGERDARDVATRMRDAQDELRSEAPTPEIPMYPAVHAEGRHTTISARVRPDPESFAGPDGGIVSALISALWSVSRACELMGPDVCSAVTAVARPMPSSP